MKLKKFFLLAVLLLSPIFSSTIVSAQTTTPPPEIELAIQANVSSIEIDSTDLTAGETVNGTITIWNSYDKDLNNLSLQMSLVSGLNGFNFSKLLDKKVLTEFNIKAGETKKIPFSYMLPLSGDANKNALYVEVYTQSSYGAGLNVLPVTVKGFISSLEILEAYVSVADKSFAVSEGPAIREGDEASIHLKVKAPENTTVTPRMSVYDFDYSGKPIFESKLSSVSLVKGVETKLNYPLERFDNNPKVYAGLITFENSNGVKVSEDIEFRYIIWGDSATIRAVTSDVISGSKGDKVNLSVEAYGAPFDIVTNEFPQMGDLDLKVTLRNGLGNIVGEHTENINFDEAKEDKIKKNIDVTLTNDAASLEVTTVIQKKDGKVLDTQVTNLSGDSVEVEAVEGKWNSLIKILLSILGILLVVLIIIKMIQNRRNASLLLGLAIVLSGLFAYQSASADIGAAYASPNPVVSGQSYTVGFDCVHQICLNKRGAFYGSISGPRAISSDPATDIQNIGVTNVAKVSDSHNTVDYTRDYTRVFTAGVPGTYFHTVTCNKHSGGEALRSESKIVSVTVVTPRTLNVQSSGASNVAITSSVSTFAGNTNYTRTSALDISTTLTAPAVSGSAVFSSWSGCTSTNLANRTCVVSVTGGATQTVVANYALVNTLNVNSSGATSVVMDSTTTGFNGTTNYTRTSASTITTTLTAPAFSGSAVFSSWSGCDLASLSDRTCDVSVTGGATKTVSVSYITPTPSSCGTANTVASFGFPSSGLCATSNTASSQVTSTTGAPHTWACTRTGSPAVSCQAPRCSTGNTYCSTSNSCILNSASCGPTSGSCTFTGNGINYSLNPSIVDTPQDTCALSWNVSSANSNTSSGAVCSPAVTCRLNNVATTVSGSQSLTPGTYTLSCTDSLNTIINRTFQCKVNPNYGEF